MKATSIAAVLVAGLMGTYAHAAEAPACADGVRIEGTKAVVSKLQRALAERGMPVEPDCGAVLVLASAAGDDFHLRIATMDGTEVERVAPDANAAATTIESFARNDLLDPLIDRPAPPAPVEVEKKAPSETVAAVGTTDDDRPFALTFALVFGVGSEGSTWTGGEVHGCFELGAVCVGGRLQLAIDAGTTGHSATLDTTRVAFDVGGTVDLPLQLGSARLTPGLGLGLGTTALFTTFDDSEIDDDTGGPQLRGQLGLELPLTGKWHLHVRAAVDVSPFASKTIFGSIGDGGDFIPLAADPLLIAWLSAGVSVGGF